MATINAWGSDLPAEVDHGGTGAVTLTDGGVLLGSGTGAVTALGQGTNGQLVIASTGVDPVLASLAAPAAGVTITGGAGTVTFALADDLSAVEGLATAGMVARTAADTWTTRAITGGAGITVTNGDGVAGAPDVALTTPVTEVLGGTNQTTYTTGDVLYASAANTLSKLAIGSNTDVLTLAAGIPSWAAPAAAVFPWSVVTGTTQTMAVNNGYIGNNGSGIAFTLPTTAAVGDIVRITSFGAGFATIAQNASENINIVDQVTTTGVGGSLVSTEQYASMTLVCTVANTTWNMLSMSGNWTIV